MNDTPDDRVIKLDVDAIYEEFERRIAEAESRKQHLWLTHVGYYVNPPTHTTLNATTMAVPPIVVCFLCDKFWGNQDTECPGEAPEE